VSTSKEIREVFNDDIERKTRQLINKRGMVPFLDGMNSCQIQELFHGLLDEDEIAFFARILENQQKGD